MSAQSTKTINQDLILAARKGLIPLREHTRFAGFGNMLRKELGQWFGTRTWWIQALIWILILNGITTIVAMTESKTPDALLQEVVQTFLPLCVGAVGIGVIITTQGAIVGEKELGTAAWVMSKPVSRAAFILAKIIAYAVGFSITAIIIPSSIFFFEMRQLIPISLPWLPFLAGVALAMLSMLFYLSLTLMLGTFFSSRGPVAGIGIAIVMTGLLLKGFIPLQVLIFTPWLLPDISSAVALEMPLPPTWFVPIVAVSCWIILVTAAALVRFEREEF